MKPVLFLMLLLTCICSHAQVNAYARVTSISSTTLSVSAVNETYDSFTAGNQVLIIQMQDNVIGSNTSNNSSFGNLSSIASAGTFELAIVSSVQRTAGVPTQIVLNSPLSKTFNTGSNSLVQIVTYRLLGTSGFTTTSDISAVAWNGSVGGVVAFRINGTLTLDHNISADYAGFKGGTVNSGTAGSCDGNAYISSVNDLYGNKGESIYKVTNSNYAAGRAKILNGGGGGNSHNGGGGGGSNVTSGGEGGKGYNCSSNAGGLGGTSLELLVTPERVFMGGGGGAGEANNSYNTAGGAGGGIIIVTASQIRTTGSGTALRISANGQTPANVGNDGAGGGGGGGSILLNVANWNIASTKTLAISANGGSGGNVTDATAHGGGGGGGQGAVIFNSVIPSTNITTTTSNGSGGRNYAGGTFAGSGGGSNNLGIYAGSFAVLPAKMTSFKAVKKNEGTILTWTAVNAETLEQFEVERSVNGTDFEKIASVKAIGGRRLYDFTDQQPPSSLAYYRIILVDKNKQQAISNVLSVKDIKSDQLQFMIHPNPVAGAAEMHIHSDERMTATMRIVNMHGMPVHTQKLELVPGESVFPFNTGHQLKAGHYQVLISTQNSQAATRITILK